MSEVLLVASFSAPLAVLFFHMVSRRGEPWLVVLAPVPALLCAIAVPDGAVLDVPWLFLGSWLGMDATGRIFLGTSSLLWLLAALYGVRYLAEDDRRRRYCRFFLLAMIGNLGVAVAADALVYLLFFAIMSFSVYGLVVHANTVESLRAGRVYMVLVVAGEVLLFGALATLGPEVPDLRFHNLTNGIGFHPARDWIMAMLVAGFGIKLGMVPLHVWLPLAHPAAPTPASAVLSGAMIKTGLLGWLRLLPLGLGGFSTWGWGLLLAGLGGAYYAVIVGLGQREAKTVLAYSSVSQMGLMTAAVGAGLLAPEAWPLLNTAVCLYVVHHALAKAGLFLGVGVIKDLTDPRQHRIAVGVLIVLAGALAGAPLTSGATAKVALKSALSAAGPLGSVPLDLLLTASAMGTAALMFRFWRIVRQPAGGAHATGSALTWAPVGLLALLVLSFPWWTASFGPPWPWSVSGPVWSGIWPLAAGIVFGGGLEQLAARRGRSLVKIPPGDILEVGRILGREIRRREPVHRGAWAMLPRFRSEGDAAHRLEVLLGAAEEWLREWSVAGSAMIGVVLLLWWLIGY